MNMDIEQISTSLKSIAGITHNFKPEKPDSLHDASAMISELCMDENNGLFTIFSSTQMMTKNYLDKIITGDQTDIEPVNDGVILLRAIARSVATGRDFIFEDKDIKAVIDGLETIKTEIEQTDNVDKIYTDINRLYALCIDSKPDDIKNYGMMAEILTGSSLSDKSPYHIMFSSVKEMAAGYLASLQEGSKNDKGPFQDAVLLLRAIVRSEKNNSDFLFESKDIIDIIENLNDTNDILNNLIDSSGDQFDVLFRMCKEISAMVLDIEPDDIPALGELLNHIESVETHLHEEPWENLSEIFKNVKQYIVKIILGETTDIMVISETFQLISSYIKALEDDEPLTTLFSEIMNTLSIKVDEDNSVEIPVMEKRKVPAATISSPVKDLEDDDIEVLEDFLVESRDNLESIEINLIDLEQSPDDKEIINAIFRPFHTIKGVSAFLDLRKINALSHSTENLLDSARDGEFIIDNEITDLILKSVDVLKQLLDRVDQGVEQLKTADDNDIEINDLIEKIEKTNTAATSVANKNKPVGEILVEKGCIDEQELTDALKTQGENPDKKIGEILIENQVVESKEIISAIREQKRGRKQSSPQVKVDTGKLDNLVDLTGELVIAQSMLKQNSFNGNGKDQKVIQNLNHLGQIVSNIQKIAMSMRMVPINATFQKMVRLVRDLSRSCNKEVHLDMIGKETEIDRNVVEALYEPMVHMIRNSIDHGIETKEEREAAGKPEKGVVTLHAYHKGGNIVIEISDDGKGLSIFNILEKAIQSGLITGEEDLSDEQIYQLVMAPGFSTAAEITDISGRGVGMDVVKKAIEELSGRVDIHSEEGKGSTFTISLPLTLAIIEGMLVRVGDEKFIIPTMAILESSRPLKKDFYTVEAKGEMLMFRNSLIPLIRLNKICNVTMDNETVWESIVIVVENKNDQRGILIDELLGKEEFVIKSLGESLKGIKGLAGGAILGDGRVGLIIDINGIFHVADTSVH